MTRYTKLDKRKAPHKATDLSIPRYDQTSDELVPEAGPSKAAIEVAAPLPVATEAPLEQEQSKTSSSDVTPPVADPKKLQSRLKLLRLKLKNAKTTEKQASIRAEMKKVEESVHAVNGQRGSGPTTSTTSSNGKRKRADDSTASASTETNPWKKMEAERRAVTSARSEARREKRQLERDSQTRCFACRGMGHAAKDCPEALNSNSTALSNQTEEEALAEGGEGIERLANGLLTGKETVGICFRCGSKDHILAKCRRATPKTGDELPFATCFVCGAKGHLSSRCPSNASKGIYPNGGSCKLCSSVEHLAKDCPLRQSSATAATNATISAGYNSRPRGQADRGGGDDDDFHDFARKKLALEKEEKTRNASETKRAKGVAGSGTAPVKSKAKVVSF